MTEKQKWQQEWKERDVRLRAQAKYMMELQNPREMMLRGFDEAIKAKLRHEEWNKETQRTMRLADFNSNMLDSRELVPIPMLEKVFKLQVELDSWRTFSESRKKEWDRELDELFRQLEELNKTAA